MKKWIGIFCLATTFIACEKKVNFIPEEQPAKLVVDAQIESGTAPTVVLTTSLSYFSSISASLLANTFVHNAVVTITNGTGTNTLKEYSINIGGGYKLYYYTSDSSLTNQFKGEFGKTYNLQIISNGQTYTSTTQIPVLAKKIDSLWWKKSPNNPDTTRAILMCRATDPAGYGNYIRYFSKVNRGDYLPGSNSVFDDQIVDGTTYDIQIDQGIDRNNPPSNDEAGYFHRGDTITIKNCNIDKATYTFWNTWEFAQQAVGNPFSSPNKVIGNISNGALGAFCGYAVQKKSLIIPK